MLGVLSDKRRLGELLVMLKDYMFDIALVNSKERQEIMLGIKLGRKKYQTRTKQTTIHLFERAFECFIHR